MEFNGGLHSICFRLKVTFLDKFRPKTEDCQFQLKFGTYSNLNMKNSLAMFILSVFELKYFFFGKFVSNNRLLKL